MTSANPPAAAPGIGLRRFRQQAGQQSSAGPLAYLIVLAVVLVSVPALLHDRDRFAHQRGDVGEHAPVPPQRRDLSQHSAGTATGAPERRSVNSDDRLGARSPAAPCCAARWPGSRSPS